MLSQNRSIIFSREIYVTAAMAAALAYVALDAWGAPREAAVVAGILTGFGLRAGALLWGWELPRYRPTPLAVRPGERTED